MNILANMWRRYVRMRLDTIDAKLDMILAKENIEMASIQDVSDRVSEQTTVIEGVTVLLDSLAQQIKDAGQDPVKLNQIVSDIQANTDKLSAAVARDTDAHDELHSGGM